MRFCCGLSPSAQRWEHVPVVVGRLKNSLVVCKTRPDIRVRIRRIVIRIRIRHTAIRIRVVVATINHTACGELHQNFLFGDKVTQ